jgi:exodeoxyribonuclease VII large subunit
VLEERLAHSTARLVTCAPARARSQETRIEAAQGRLQALDPARILARGWSITRTTDGAVARDAAALEPGAGLVTTLQHGTVTSTVSPAPPPPREADDAS